MVGQADTAIEIHEGPCRFQVDLEAGQKTGFYLDQRENRAQVGARAAGRAVLDAFSYTGAFAAWALRSGATSVLALDSSGEACARPPPTSPRTRREGARGAARCSRPTPSTPSAPSSGTAAASTSSS